MPVSVHNGKKVESWNAGSTSTCNKISSWRLTRNESPCQWAWQSQIRDRIHHQPFLSSHLEGAVCYWDQLVWISRHTVWTCWERLAIMQLDLLSQKEAHFSRSVLLKQLLCSHGDSSTLNSPIPAEVYSAAVMLHHALSWGPPMHNSSSIPNY